MSLLKNSLFWLIAGIIAMVAACAIRSASSVCFMVFYVLAPLAFGFAVRTYLNNCEFIDK